MGDTGNNGVEERLPPPDKVFVEDQLDTESLTKRLLDTDALDSWNTVKRLLPPMPKPANQVVQKIFGTVLVVALAVILILLAYHALDNGSFPSAIKWIMLGVMVALAVVALFLLFLIMTVDTGEIQRSEETCLPIPEEVKEKIISRVNAGKKPNFKRLCNIYDGKNVYCIRCCVWRRYKTLEVSSANYKKMHHCSLCQRCVDDFDHHCSFFGRCIAGKGIKNTLKEGRIEKGTMLYFQLILIVGLVGFLIALTLNVIYWVERTTGGSWDTEEAVDTVLMKLSKLNY